MRASLCLLLLSGATALAAASPLGEPAEHFPVQKRVDQLIETPPLPSPEEVEAITEAELDWAYKRPIAGNSWGKRGTEDVGAM